MATDIHVEQEIKFAAARTFKVPHFGSLVGRSVRHTKASFRTAYFDTSDLRLWSRGITLRYRSPTTGGPGTWTVKLPDANGGATLNRGEISWPTVQDDVPVEARRLLRGLIRRADLDRVVEMDTTRIPWTLQDHAGNEWAELDDDDVTIVAGPKDGVRYRQIELERTRESSDDQAISAVADALQQAGAEPDDQPKLAKALGLSAARRPALEAEAPPASTAADVVRHAVFDGLERLLDHDYRLRLCPDDPDGDDVHQARVATRRLRSNLKTLRPLLDPIWVTHTVAELRWMGALLGAVRDADVMEAALIPPDKSKLSRSGSDSMAELRTKLAAERANAVAGLGEALASQRYLDLLDRLHAAASHPPLTDGSDNTLEPLRAREVLPKLVGRRLRRMKKSVATAGRSPTDEQLHRMRIAAKNLRYASELSQAVIGKAARKTARLAEDIQTVLGDYHDAAASIEWLTQAGGTGRGSGLAAGVLITEQDRRQKKLAKRWHHQWDELLRPARRRWLAEAGP